MIEHISEKDLVLAFDGELPPDRSEAVQVHTRACAECEKRWAGLQNLSLEVAALHAPGITFQPQETAVAALLSRIENTPRRAHWTTRSLVFANALVAVAVGITCMVVWHPAAHPAVVYDLEQAVPPGFVSLPYADPALPLDDAAVLPVELSAEDLESMGFDANEAPRNGVEAELLIGMDGWPRAIRIVEQF